MLMSIYYSNTKTTHWPLFTSISEPTAWLQSSMCATCLLTCLIYSDTFSITIQWGIQPISSYLWWILSYFKPVHLPLHVANPWFQLYQPATVLCLHTNQPWRRLGNNTCIFHPTAMIVMYHLQFSHTGIYGSGHKRRVITPQQQLPHTYTLAQCSMHSTCLHLAGSSCTLPQTLCSHAHHPTFVLFAQ